MEIMMKAQLKELHELQAQLHEMSRQWVRAAPRLRGLVTSNAEEQRRLRIRLQEVEARYESIVGQIDELVQVENENTKDEVI